MGPKRAEVCVSDAGGSRGSCPSALLAGSAVGLDFVPLLSRYLYWHLCLCLTACTCLPGELIVTNLEPWFPGRLAQWYCTTAVFGCHSQELQSETHSSCMTLGLPTFCSSNASSAQYRLQSQYHNTLHSQVQFHSPLIQSIYGLRHIPWYRILCMEGSGEHRGYGSGGGSSSVLHDKADGSTVPLFTRLCGHGGSLATGLSRVPFLSPFGFCLEEKIVIQDH